MPFSWNLLKILYYKMGMSFFLINMKFRFYNTVFDHCFLKWVNIIYHRKSENMLSAVLLACLLKTCIIRQLISYEPVITSYSTLLETNNFLSNLIIYIDRTHPFWHKTYSEWPSYFNIIIQGCLIGHKQHRHCSLR